MASPSLVNMSAASWGGNLGRLDVVYRASDGTLGHVWYDDRVGWGGPESRGGQVTGRPAIVSRGQGLLDIIACNPSGGISHVGYDDSIGWTAWTDLDVGTYHPIVDPPAAVAVDQNTVHVAARSTDKHVIDTWSTGTTWAQQPFKPVSVATVNSPPAGLTRGPEQLDFAVLGLTAPLWQIHGFIDPGGSGDWLWSGVANNRLPSDPQLLGTPAIVAQDMSRLDVFALDDDGAIWHMGFHEPGPWTRWDSLGGSFVSPPCATSRAATEFDVFAVGVDEHLHMNSWDGAYTGWFDLGGSLIGNPSVVTSNTGRLDIFAEQSDETLGHIRFIPPTLRPPTLGEWSSWETRGGPIG